MSTTGQTGTAAQPPCFGALSGVKVAYAAPAVAGPFCVNLMAEQGADVIWIENAKAPEPMRKNSPWFMESDRRNQRTISLDIQHERGREVFLKLISSVDIFVEASKGGQYERWGLTDDVLWQANPRLVIVHISGFGLSGVPEYVRRASYDPIAQAFGCTLQLNGYPDRAPVSAQPFPADYITGLFACCGALMALHRARETGQGESVDVAQFETMVRAGGGALMNYLNCGIAPEREGQRNPRFAGVGSHECADGEYIYAAGVGLGVLAPGLRIIGCNPNAEIFHSTSGALLLGTPGGAALDEALVSFCRARTAKDAASELSSVGVPASAIYTYAMAEEDPHYKAREVFIEWERDDGSRARGSAVIPRLSRNPGRIWRGAPSFGKDNETILAGLGLSRGEIEELYSAGAVTRPS